MNIPPSITSVSQEDIFTNPFFAKVREEDSLLQYAAGGGSTGAAESGRPPVILVPCQRSLSGQPESASLSRHHQIEAHILQSAHVPGQYCNLRGQGLEIKSDRVITGVGFGQRRICHVTQTENMYDYGTNFKIFVLDRPVCGAYTSGRGGAGPASLAMAGPCDWLSGCPQAEDDFYDKIFKFRQTYLLVPGYEKAAAVRIRDIASEAVAAVERHEAGKPSGLVRPVAAPPGSDIKHEVERTAYATLHAFIFPHILQYTLPEDTRLTERIRRYAIVQEFVFRNYCNGGNLNLRTILAAASAPKDILAAKNDVLTRSVQSLVAELGKLDNQIAPMDKLSAMTVCGTALEHCQKLVSEIVRSSLLVTAPDQGGPARVEVSADHVLAMFVAAIASLASSRDRANTRVQINAHMCHVDMYVEAHDELKFSQGQYAVSTIHSALEFWRQPHAECREFDIHTPEEEATKTEDTSEDDKGMFDKSSSIFEACLRAGSDEPRHVLGHSANRMPSIRRSRRQQRQQQQNRKELRSTTVTLLTLLSCYIGTSTLLFAITGFHDLAETNVPAQLSTVGSLRGRLTPPRVVTPPKLPPYSPPLFGVWAVSAVSGVLLLSAAVGRSGGASRLARPLAAVAFLVNIGVGIVGGILPLLRCASLVLRLAKWSMSLSSFLTWLFTLGVVSPEMPLAWKLYAGAGALTQPLLATLRKVLPSAAMTDIPFTFLWLIVDSAAHFAQSWITRTVLGGGG
ncbi:hypothetical protein FOZ61_007209 [Perkinsus olseni]|uniref:VPS9 domain-containing protein n=2 Tax=Perkinsus olseni TaxID=32597 RepID=A0A7J6M9D4_PEROL|nr:hypothetical protein FOZ61_007209 [Perkinsus olseni]